MAREEDVRSTLHLLTGTHHGPQQPPRGRRAAAPTTAAAPAAAVPAEVLKWLWSEGIVGLGVAEKEVCGTLTNEVVLKIYVEEKKSSHKVAHPIPKMVKIGDLPPIETDVVQAGRIKRQSNTAMVRPAIPGYSIGLGTQPQEAGTFGLVVRKKGKPQPWYLLSNSHAIAASGCATVGDPIIQPGGADGGTTAADTIASLTEWIPFTYGQNIFPNLVDAAIAQLQPDAATAAIAQLGVPTGINTTLKRGDYVQKMGRTTTLSVARVMDVDLTTPSTYPTCSGGVGVVGFSDQVLVTFYSAGGDSGSPVLDMKNRVVGLHVAGSEVIGVFCKIANIMSLLDIEVVTTKDVGTTS